MIIGGTKGLLDYITIFILFIYGLFDCKIFSFYRNQIHSYQVGIITMVQTLSLLVRVTDFSLGIIVVCIPISLYLIVNDIFDLKCCMTKYKTIFFSLKSL